MSAHSLLIAAEICFATLVVLAVLDNVFWYALRSASRRLDHFGGV